MGIIEEQRKKRITRWISKGGVKNFLTFGEIEKKIEDIDIELGEKLYRGQYVDLYRPKALEKMYARKNLCLKIFKEGTEFWGRDCVMGYSNILESTMTQSFMADRGLAPYIYDIVKYKGKYAQVSEFITGDYYDSKIEDPRFIFHGSEVSQPHNLIDGKLVDFQGVIFKDHKAVKRSILAKAQSNVKSVGASGGAYQTTLHFKGLRDTTTRLKRYNLKNFKDKVVLDIGCNYGMFSREAIRQGAKRVVGLDRPEITGIARDLAIIDGYYNIDFYGVDLKTLKRTELQKMTGIERFDTHLFLALVHWVGMPDYLSKCDTLYTEGHGAERRFCVYDLKNNPDVKIVI